MWSYYNFSFSHICMRKSIWSGTADNKNVFSEKLKFEYHSYWRSWWSLVLQQARLRTSRTFRNMLLNIISSSPYINDSQFPVTWYKSLRASDDLETLHKKSQFVINQISDIIPGEDGKVRTVKCKTEHGVIIRRNQRVLPFEISHTDISNYPFLLEKIIKSIWCEPIFFILILDLKKRIT